MSLAEPKGPSQNEIERLLPIRSRLLFDLSINSPLEFSGNTFWEELTCVGYSPQEAKLEVQPATHLHGPAVLPPCRVYTSIADSGDTAATYTIDTSQLDKCGYALILRGFDRTIIDNNGAIVHSNAKAVGFSVV
jgi:hypothetical protein